MELHEIKIHTATLIDPTGHWRAKGYTPGEILDACGFVPHWFAIDMTQRRAIEVIDHNYPYPVMPYKGSFSINSKGVMVAPGDPAQYPYIALYRSTNPANPGETETIYQYPEGWVVVLDQAGGETLLRVD